MSTVFRKIIIIIASLSGLSCNKVKSMVLLRTPKLECPSCRSRNSWVWRFSTTSSCVCRVGPIHVLVRPLRVDLNFSISFPENKQNVLAALIFRIFNQRSSQRTKTNKSKKTIIPRWKHALRSVSVRRVSIHLDPFTRSCHY